MLERLMASILEKGDLLKTQGYLGNLEWDRSEECIYNSLLLKRTSLVRDIDFGLHRPKFQISAAQI
jgi:hypothetical protein